MEIRGTDEVIAELDRLGIRATMRAILRDLVPLALRERGPRREVGNALMYDFSVTVAFVLLDTNLPSEWKAAGHRQMICTCQLVRYDFGPADHAEHVDVMSFATSP